MSPALTSFARPRASAGLGTAALAALLLGACAASGPDFQPPKTTHPAQWSDWHAGDPALAAGAGDEAVDTARRWQGIEDAVLAKLQSRAVAASPDLRLAALRVAEARAQTRTVQAQDGPQVSGRAGAMRERLSANGSSTRLVDAIGTGTQREQLVQFLATPFSVWQAGFDASWELDLWGRVRRSVEAAHAAQAEAGDMQAQARLVLRAEVARNYFALRALQREQGEARIALAAARETLALRAAQVNRGLVDDTARLAARQQMAELEGRDSDLAAALAATLDALALLCGDRPGALDADLAAPDVPPPLPELPAPMLGPTAEFLSHRPDVAAAEHRLAQATAGIGMAVADLYPRIALTASAGLESLHARDFADWGSRQWSVGPSLALPLFDQGRRRATIELRELQQQEAAVAFQQAVLHAWHDVDDAVTAWSGARADLQAARSREADSEQADMLAQARWRRGLTDQSVALQARLQLAQARLATAERAGLLAQRWIAVAKALGDDGTLPVSQN